MDKTNYAQNNFWKGCPAMMSYSQFTDYRSASCREDTIKRMNGISCRSDNAYRYFLQNNAQKILDDTSKIINTTLNYMPNQCLHTSGLRQCPHAMYDEMKTYTAVRTGKIPVTAVPPCKHYMPYKLN